MVLSCLSSPSAVISNSLTCPFFPAHNPPWFIVTYRIKASFSSLAPWHSGLHLQPHLPGTTHPKHCSHGLTQSKPPDLYSGYSLSRRWHPLHTKVQMETTVTTVVHGPLSQLDHW